ncbi:arrestin domain-containing protein 2-like isoform X2 [Nomia melanderi]|uniref:arrestin domain-containing protein 2-like isoform X2 n=1 Tax=Nomia melanderi TaxID=2448451 RepID=UPI003FCD2B75
MTSLRTFRIEFERPGATYLVGEIVKGTIILDTTKEKNIRGLHFTAKGSAHVHWTESSETGTGKDRRTTSTSYYASQEYFKIKGNILGTDGDSRVKLSEGYHQYPFEFLLPCNIPSSFEHSVGYVRYTVKSVIDRPWKFDHECKAAFTVVSVLDLNMHRERCLGIHDEAQKTFRSLCCFNMGSLSTVIRVPSSGYVPGQMIITVVDYKNFSNGIPIAKISMKLEREIKFHTTTKTRTEHFEVMASSYSGPFTSDGQIYLELRIPPIPPSYLQFCDIIDLNYNLKILVHFPGAHRRIEKRYPLLIGTIPIYSTPSAPPNEQTHVRPAIGKEPAPPVPMPLPEASHSNVPGRHIGFIMPDQAGTSSDYDIPPPSYEECVSRAQHIKDVGESDYVYGASTPFAPKYPVFNYPVPNAPGN